MGLLDMSYSSASDSDNSFGVGVSAMWYSMYFSSSGCVVQRSIIIMVFLILLINDVPIEKSSSERHDDEGVHLLLHQNKAAELAQLC
ncbi:hypothetical protein DPX16_2690 [Anabarilius grahami]|uniref:Uncharacterized protein n=1 Tax=Anabarilius grahami TaxID=495550 RepID=A0A3N0YQY6_ANAGA|nr:hypothetical protein DPX16_2690 [Anabarilius grahami]